MKPPSATPEQKQIAELQHALEVAMYWLLQCYEYCDLGNTSHVVLSLLCNHGLDPTSKQAKALLKRCPEAYHHELEKAVKRTVGK